MNGIIDFHIQGSIEPTRGRINPKSIAVPVGAYNFNLFVNHSCPFVHSSSTVSIHIIARSIYEILIGMARNVF